MYLVKDRWWNKALVQRSKKNNFERDPKQGCRTGSEQGKTKTTSKLLNPNLEQTFNCIKYRFSKCFNFPRLRMVQTLLIRNCQGILESPVKDQNIISSGCFTSWTLNRYNKNTACQQSSCKPVKKNVALSQTGNVSELWLPQYKPSFITSCISWKIDDGTKP